MRLPLTIVALLYASGIVLGQYVSPPLWLLFASSLALAVAAVCCGTPPSILAVRTLVFFGWTNLTTQTATLSPFDLRSEFWRFAASRLGSRQID